MCSGVADSILSGQFEEDLSWYETQFNAFLIAHLKESVLNRVGAGEQASKLLTDALHMYGQFAVVRGSSTNKDWPNSFATLMKAEELDGEVGIEVKNAIIYAVAMITVSDTKTQTMKDLIAGNSFMAGAKNTKTPEEYRDWMLEKHPRAAAVAETIANLESKKAAHNVVAMMGHFIDKGGAGGANETKHQRGLRILEE